MPCVPGATQQHCRLADRPWLVEQDCRNSFRPHLCSEMRTSTQSHAAPAQASQWVILQATFWFHRLLSQASLEAPTQPVWGQLIGSEESQEAQHPGPWLSPTPRQMACLLQPLRDAPSQLPLHSCHARRLALCFKCVPGRLCNPLAGESRHTWRV